ncbi:hypothetical protein H0H93_010619, partial [Arthromyces matolae]
MKLSIVCISGTTVPASVLMDRDGPPSILAGELLTDNTPLPKYRPESVAATEFDPPPTFLLVPRAPISIDKVREIGKKVEKQVETVVDSEPGAWKNPDDVERFLRTTLEVYAILVDAESKILPDNPARLHLVPKLVNLRHSVYSALDVGTEILYDALKGREVARITEKNGTKLIELVTKLARQMIDHPQRSIGTGDWALFMKE